MQHDIYAVGAVLLEIELWNSFVISRSGVEAWNPGPLLNSLKILQIKNQNKRALRVKETL